MLHARQAFLWLEMIERGATARAIASRFKFTVGAVEVAVDQARAQVAAFVEMRRLMTPPPLYLIFPLNGLFPDSRCNHDRVAIPADSLACCEVCSRSGCDGHPVMDRFPSLEPRPEPPPPVVKPEAAPLTRREKRARKLAVA